MGKGTTFFLGAVCTGGAVGFFEQSALGFGTMFLILGVGMVIHSFVNFIQDGGRNE